MFRSDDLNTITRYKRNTIQDRKMFLIRKGGIFCFISQLSFCTKCLLIILKVTLEGYPSHYSQGGSFSFVFSQQRLILKLSVKILRYYYA